MNLQKVFDEHDFSDAEKEFMGQSLTPNTGEINQSRITSEFVLGKRIEKAAERVIESNKALAASTDKYSKVLIILTELLVVLAVYQVLMTMIHPDGIWLFGYMVALIVIVVIFHKYIDKVLGI